MANFNFVGKLRRAKDGVAVKETNAWTTKKFSFGVKCGDDCNYVSVDSFLWNDPSKNTMSLKKASDPKERVEVDWDERFDEDVIKSVSFMSKYVIDLGEDNKVYYLSASDFIDDVVELVENEKYKDAIFNVSGEITYEYADGKKGPSYYKKLKVRRITLAQEDTNEVAGGTYSVYYDQDFLGDENSDGLTNINVYERFYNRKDKKNYYAPVALVIDRKDETCDKIVKMMGSRLRPNTVNVAYFDVVLHKGAQKEAVKYEDLTDDQKEYVDLFGISPEEYGTQAYGEKKEYTQIVDINRKKLNNFVEAENVLEEELHVVPNLGNEEEPADEIDDLI